jgi:hypothetical protein
MKLSLSQKSELVSRFWKDAPSVCPRHDVPMRTFFVERVYKPQVVMVCPKGEMFRFDQKPKQIEFSRPHVKTMVLDAQERETPACSQDFATLVVYRTPAIFIPQGWDYTFICPSCLSYGEWVNTGRPEEEAVTAAPIKKEEAPPFHDETIPLPKRMEMAKEGDLSTKLYAALRRQREGPQPLRAGQGGDRAGREGPPQGHRSAGFVRRLTANVRRRTAESRTSRSLAPRPPPAAAPRAPGRCRSAGRPAGSAE